MRYIIILLSLVVSAQVQAQRNIGAYRQIIGDTLSDDSFVLKLTTLTSDTTDHVVVTKIINYRNDLSGEIVIRWTAPINGRGNAAARELLRLQRVALREEEVRLRRELSRNLKKQGN
jgi:hypothetical protein